MYNPVNLLEAVADVSNLLEAKRLLFESGLLTEAELKDLAGLDKSLDYLDKEVDKALKYSQNLEKIFGAIEPKEIAVREYKKLFPKIKSNINKAKTDVVEKLKELPKALKSIAQRDFSSSITKRIPIGSDIADAGRAIGDFFGKDSTEGYMLSQVESIAQELTELNSLLKAIISTIARALKYSKGSDEILKIEDESLFNIFLSGKTTGEDEDQAKGQKLIKGIGKELKKRAKMGLKQDLSVALRNLNPFAKTDDLFGLERSAIISLWFSMSPAQFMKLGPALLKPLNKGTIEIGKAAAAVQKDEEEVKKETSTTTETTPSETKVDDAVEELSDASDSVSKKTTPERIENTSDAIEEVSVTFKAKKDALMKLLKYESIKETYEKAIDIIASNHEADEKGLYWPSYVIKMAADYEGGKDQFYKDFDKGKFGENLPALFQRYSGEFTNLAGQVLRAQNEGEENSKSLEKQIEQAIEAVNRTAGELKKAWDSRKESKEGEVNYDSAEALAKLKAADALAEEEKEKDKITITPQYIENHPQNEFDKYIKNLKATKDAKKYFVEGFLNATLEDDLINFWIYGAEFNIKQLGTLSEDEKFQDLLDAYQKEHLASQELTKQILDADLSEVTDEEEMVKAINLSKEQLDAQLKKYNIAALALKKYVDEKIVIQAKATAESKWLSNDQLLKSLKYSLKPILEEDISSSLLQLMPSEKKVQKPKVIVERQEKKKDILLERWQKLAGLE